MILKPYKRNQDNIEILYALLRQETDASMKRIIEQDIKNARKGSSGEYQVAHNIDREYGSSENMAIFYDLRIPDGTGEGRYTQIDALLVHGTLRRAWAIEVKNWGGKVGIDEKEQWWREYKNGERVIVKSPLTQAQYCAEALARWFKANNWPIREVIPCLGFAAEVVLDDSVWKECPHVFKADLFRNWHKLEMGDFSLWTIISRLRENRRQPIRAEQLQLMAKELLEDHTPVQINHQARYGEVRLDAAKKVATTGYDQKIQISDGVFLLHAPGASSYALKLDITKIVAVRPTARSEIRERLGDNAIFDKAYGNWRIPQEEGAEVARRLQEWFSIPETEA